MPDEPTTTMKPPRKPKNPPKMLVLLRLSESEKTMAIRLEGAFFRLIDGCSTVKTGRKVVAASTTPDGKLLTVTIRDINDKATESEPRVTVKKGTLE